MQSLKLSYSLFPANGSKPCASWPEPLSAVGCCWDWFICWAYEDEFKQIQPAITAFLEILPKLQDIDNKPIYPYPSSLKQFIKSFREYYEYFQEHHLANLTIKDNTVYKIREDAPIIIESPVPLLSEHLHESLHSGDKLRKAAKKLYSVAKEDAVYAVKRYHEMIE